MNFNDKIKELKIELPEAKAPVGSYVATKVSGKLLFVSGQISINANGLSAAMAFARKVPTDNLLILSIINPIGLDIALSNSPTNNDVCTPG